MPGLGLSEALALGTKFKGIFIYILFTLITEVFGVS